MTLLDPDVEGTDALAMNGHAVMLKWEIWCWTGRYKGEHEYWCFKNLFRIPDAHEDH